MKMNFGSMIENLTCAECGEKKMKLGYSSGEGSMHIKTKVLGVDVFSQASRIVSILCSNCGLIVKSYVEEPESF